MSERCVAAAGAAASEEDASVATRLAGLRGRLQAHLQSSGLVDGGTLLVQLRGSALWEEQVLLHSKVCCLSSLQLSGLWRTQAGSLTCCCPLLPPVRCICRFCSERNEDRSVCCLLLR